MAILRTIALTITSQDVISPSIPTMCGYEGEHLATRLAIAVPATWQTDGALCRVLWQASNGLSGVSQTYATSPFNYDLQQASMVLGNLRIVVQSVLTVAPDVQVSNSATFNLTVSRGTPNAVTGYTYEPEIVATGGMSGPMSAVDGNFVAFDGIVGTKVKDSGSKASDFESAIGAKGTAFNKSYGTTSTDVKVNGTQGVGVIDAVARIDHVHPVDTSRQVAGTYLTSANIDDTAFGAGWDGDTTHAPTKNAVYDKVNGLALGAQVADIGSTAETVGGSVANGSAGTAARSDHKHAITNPAIDTLAAATDITTRDVSTTAHGLAPKAVAPAAGLINVYGIANAETAISNKPLFDATTPATETVGGVGSVGTATVAARRDHTHPITNPALDTLSATTDITTLNATTTSHGLVVKAVAPAAGLYNYVGITNAETAYTNKALFDATVPVTQAFSDAASAGSSAVAARRDHVHGMMAAPTSVTGNSGTVTGLTFTNSKTATVAGNFGVAWAKYVFGTDGGTVATKTPGATANTTIPANAIIFGGAVNVTTACTSGGSGTLAIGTAGTGGSTTCILGATGVASLTLNAVLSAVCTTTPKKMTGSGGITFTIGTTALTAGVVEAFVFYFTAAA